MTNIFLSNDNKGLLWEMMLSNNMFDGVSDDNFTNVKMMFDNVILRIGQGIKDNISREELLSLNKTAVIEIKNNLDFFKRKNNKETFDNEKILLFDKNLETAKNDFAESISIKKPKQPDFTATIDKPIETSNMNDLLDKLQRERDQLIVEELETNNTKKKLTFIDSDTTQKNINTFSGNELKKISNIEELFISQENNNNNQNKQVRFEDNNLSKNVNEEKMFKNINEIISHEYKGEKRINDNLKLNSILNLLTEINNKQNQIIDLLQKTDI